ncbi:hypothetical protein JMJ77_0014451 [Colletotrichum scovillei]|uniref:Uncharacterized protein n=1 Tax=Colletotrichum scovillei TaxID=1209932 RepID=A0A9P7UC13_9PEZI|nr:hypothetical protein JMJ77_0014451 [Colletotrichum scovillei]KAG7065979.1 hypothetical protein JMJ78_0012721 [Colletotrichum scovillei]KAG7068587.1 hypothetical protein JMJ76_0008270 [Colletotrichum scovillei]
MSPISALALAVRYSALDDKVVQSGDRVKFGERLASNAFSVTKEDDAAFMLDVGTGAEEGGGGGGGGDALTVIGGSGKGGSSAGNSEGPEKSVGSAGSDRECNTADRPSPSVEAIVKSCGVLKWLVGVG